MNEADEALADVRGWLCDNLSEGDAGKACGMLSAVSRHITALESENASLRGAVRGLGELCDKYKAENAKLRELIQKTWKWEKNGCYECPLKKDCKVLCVYDGDCGIAVEIEKELQELGIEVVE